MEVERWHMIQGNVILWKIVVDFYVTAHYKKQAQYAYWRPKMEIEHKYGPIYLFRPKIDKGSILADKRKFSFSYQKWVLTWEFDFSSLKFRNI